jgi:hypothetical protein
MGIRIDISIKNAGLTPAIATNQGAALPANAQVNEWILDAPNKKLYIWNGSSWVLALDGSGGGGGGSYLPLSGGTLTGPLIMQPSSGRSLISLNSADNNVNSGNTLMIWSALTNTVSATVGTNNNSSNYLTNQSDATILFQTRTANNTLAFLFGNLKTINPDGLFGIYSNGGVVVGNANNPGFGSLNVLYIVEAGQNVISPIFSIPGLGTVTNNDGSGSTGSMPGFTNAFTQFLNYNLGTAGFVWGFGDNNTDAIPYFAMYASGGMAIGTGLTDPETGNFYASGNIVAGGNMGCDGFNCNTFSSATVNCNNVVASANVTAGGQVSGNTLVATTSVTAASAAITNGVTATSVTGSGQVQGNTIVATTSVTAASAAITNGVTATNVTGSGQVKGNTLVATTSVTAASAAITNGVTAASVTAIGAVQGNTLVATTNTSTQHLIGTGATPTVVVGAGAGTGATATITGTDTGFLLTLTTGSSGTAANSTLATITFANAYAATPHSVFSAVDGLTAAKIAFLGLTNTNSTTLTVIYGNSVPGLNFTHKIQIITIG